MAITNDPKQNSAPLSRSIALNPTLNIALEYGQCTKCLYVFGATEDYTKTSVPCPKCNAVGTKSLWPGNSYKLNLFPVLQDLYSKHDRFGVAVVVFAFAISEGLLRCCLIDALRKKGAEYLAAKQCAEEINNTERAVRLLAKLCGYDSMAAFLKGTDFCPVLSEWENTRKLRNKIVHAQSSRIKAEDVTRAFNMCIHFPGLIRFILNRVSSNSGKSNWNERKETRQKR